MDMDKQDLYEQLTELNIMALYDFMAPIDYTNITSKSIASRRDDAIRRYRNDPIFHHRVDAMVARTIGIIEQNI